MDVVSRAQQLSIEEKRKSSSVSMKILETISMMHCSSTSKYEAET